jgi:type II secretory pathway pseudopilin PulG
MNAYAKQRGSALVIAMLLLVILLGLAATMTFNAQSQSKLTAGAKLQQFYEVAARSGFDRVRSEMSDYYVSPDSLEDSAMDYRWRFGELLTNAAAKEANNDTANGNFPFNGDSSFSSTISMNAGMLNLTQKVWVRNNPDDPAMFIAGAQKDGVLIDKNWDMDGRVVLTVEIYGPGSSDIPISVQSAIIGVAGSETAYIHDDAVSEGDYSDVANQGRGDSGSLDRIEIESLDD